jgi:hypothetical protein
VATVPVPAPVSNGQPEPEPEETAAPSRWPVLLVAILITASLAAGGLLLFLWYLLQS